MMNNANVLYGEQTETVEKLLDLLTQLEEQGNTIINDMYSIKKKKKKTFNKN